jgi:ribosomal protein L29
VATKKIKELGSLSQTELSTRLREIEGELFQAKMQHKTGQLADSAKPWRLRKDIARIKMLASAATTKTAPGKDKTGQSEKRGK